MTLPSGHTLLSIYFPTGKPRLTRWGKYILLSFPWQLVLFRAHTLKRMFSLHRKQGHYGRDLRELLLFSPLIKLSLCWLRMLSQQFFQSSVHQTRLHRRQPPLAEGDPAQTCPEHNGMWQCGMGTCIYAGAPFTTGASSDTCSSVGSGPTAPPGLQAGKTDPDAP